MYAFNSENEELAKIYVWIMNIFQSAEKRQGFVLSGVSDKEYVRSYLKQYGEIIKRAVEINDPYIIQKKASLETSVDCNIVNAK